MKIFGNVRKKISHGSSPAVPDVHSSILMEGYLYKKDHDKEMWNRRWFVLFRVSGQSRVQNLVYYESGIAPSTSLCSISL